jgi:hypothetical protein
MDNDFQAYSYDEEAVQQVAEAAFMLRYTMDEVLSGPEAEIVTGLTDAAEYAAQLLSALDTTTSGAILDELDLPPLNVTWDEESNFSIVRARIERLFQRIELCLAGLEAQGGPERAISLRLLVWQLCDLYHRETGKPVTSSAVRDYCYKAAPQSPAGRFVLACVEALQPPEAWMLEPDHRATLQRARTSKGALERGVHFAMREYVAHHPPAAPRRGRRKRAQ